MLRALWGSEGDSEVGLPASMDAGSPSRGSEPMRPSVNALWGGFAAFVLCAVVFACPLVLGGCSDSGAVEQTPRPDLVEIDIRELFDEPERARVQFPHDLHTNAVSEENEDCSLCHRVREDSLLSPKYMRLEDPGGEELMELYHENCIACHTERADAGVKTGPVTCGECHRLDPLYLSSRQPVGFDHSLHYRHGVAQNDKCEKCHHLYDEETDKLYYEKGTESSCRDCHREETEENRVSFKLAAHWDCLGCHVERAVEMPGAAGGPQDCAGCHDLERQLAIKVIEDPPRLMRGQPDFVLISAPESELESSKLATVPFSHVGHEKFNNTCRVCHHETMKPCVECHTLAGSEESEGVMLQHAMHALTSNHSCVGCHELEKSDPECAGCHDLMEQGRLSEHSCEICHAGPAPWNLEAERSLYTSLDDFRPDPSEMGLTFPVSEIPDTVMIGVLSREYEPAFMPHGKIVDKLSEHIANSKIATYFHGHEDVVCQGCHHHGAIGERPALCENCHGRPFDERNPHKPGLFAAYHRQCLGCHESMGIGEPSDCARCHAEKQVVETVTPRPDQ